MTNILLYILLLVIFNIFLAKVDANKIKKNIKIYHGENALIYIVVAGFASAITMGEDWWDFLKVVAIALLTRKVVFDIFLNLFRKLKWNYISNTTTSIEDRIENKILGKNKYVVYIIVAITLFLLIYKRII